MKDYKEWYGPLKKSPITPPSWVFGVVWPILYVLMALSAYTVWIDKKCYPFCIPLVFFIVQLIINLSWTNVFFTQRKLKLALVMLISILILTMITYYLFRGVNKMSARLLVPYIIWLCLATHLNMYIVSHN